MEMSNFLYNEVGVLKLMCENSTIDYKKIRERKKCNLSRTT